MIVYKHTKITIPSLPTAQTLGKSFRILSSQNAHIANASKTTQIIRRAISWIQFHTTPASWFVYFAETSLRIVLYAHDDDDRFLCVFVVKVNLKCVVKLKK